MGPKILAFGSHSSANFQLILDCFIPNFTLKYEDLENIKVDRLNAIVFSLYQIKHRAFFLEHPVTTNMKIAVGSEIVHQLVESIQAEFLLHLKLNPKMGVEAAM